MTGDDEIILITMGLDSTLRSYKKKINKSKTNIRIGRKYTMRMNAQLLNYSAIDVYIIYDYFILHVRILNNDNNIKRNIRYIYD